MKSAAPLASAADCAAFLAWAMPHLELRAQSFRRVRGQVYKRLRRRLGALGLADLEAYRRRLGEHPRDDPAADLEEWALLDRLCFITVSRFCRDRDVWEVLTRQIIPPLVAAARAREARAPRFCVWSAGCASGEEPYTLALWWVLRGLGRDEGALDLELELLATDADAAMLERARRARFSAQTLVELPDDLRIAGFPARAADDELSLDATFAQLPRFFVHDLRDTEAFPLASDRSSARFDLVFCRNLAFSYFSEPLQRLTVERLHAVLRPGGCLVLGKHEELPRGAEGFVRSTYHELLYRRV